MAYNLVMTEHAEEQLDSLVYYLLYRFKSKQAARHLLDGIDNVYSILEENPLQFPRCRDTYIESRGYYEATVPQMDYMVIFSIEEDTVNVVGIFHQLENYSQKL